MHMSLLTIISQADMVENMKARVNHISVITYFGQTVKGKFCEFYPNDSALSNTALYEYKLDIAESYFDQIL